jgi:thiamine-phosphate pyrophosphorylase
MNSITPDYSLYLVTDRDVLGERQLVNAIEAAINGGVTLLQLREKNLSTLAFYEEAIKVKSLTDKFNIPLIINDRLDIALACNADGLHIGQDDMPLGIARNFLGHEKIIGVSVSCVEEALLAEKNGADYIGVGAIFPTLTKNDTEKVTLHTLKEIKKAVKIPVVAIGGISEHNLAQVLETGIDGISVVSAILGKDDIKTAAEKLYSKLKC